MIPAAPSERETPASYRPCVGIVLADAQGRVWAGRRVDADSWQMPQGGIDEGESVEAAALRELREETGLSADLVRLERVAEFSTAYDVPPDLVPAHWNGRFRGQALTWVLLRFLGQDADVDVAQTHAEFAAWRWASLPDLADEVVPWKRTAYARAVEEFGAAP